MGALALLAYLLVCLFVYLPDHEEDHNESTIKNIVTRKKDGAMFHISMVHLHSVAYLQS